MSDEESEENIDDAHQDCIQPAAEVARDAADDRAQDRREEGRADSDEERHAGPVDDQDEKVEAQATGGAERVSGRERRTSREGEGCRASRAELRSDRRYVRGVVREEDGPERADRHHYEEDASPDQGQVVLSKAAPGQLPLVQGNQRYFVIRRGGVRDLGNVFDAWIHIPS